MKNNKSLALLLVLVLVFALVPSAFAADNVEPFTDVLQSHYFAEPVAWAVENEVTAGTSKTTFSPNDDCTREQIVTFLHRAEGKPAAASAVNPFSDVKADSYALNAILWAVEQGVTVGTGKNTFSPAAKCTRAQIVTFLYRTAGEPKVADTKNPFSDVKADSYALNAILWAVENGITQGTGNGKFSPDDTCTRAQAVTFLYRYYHLTESAYVLMNIPYGEFYAAEGTSDVDAVSSSTKNKTRTVDLAKGSYHKNADGTDLSGVVYPVFVSDVSVLKDLKEVTDSDTVSITVTNRGQTSTTELKGKDCLFENEDYAYYKLESEPNSYKTLTVGADGKFAFSAATAKPETVKMETALTYGGHHTDITYKVTCDALPQSGIVVHGVVITAQGADGKDVAYGLRHVYEIWRVIELGWNWEDLDGAGLSGKTITSVTYYIQNEKGEYQTLTCKVNDTLELQPAEITAEVTDENTITVAGVPADAKNVTATVKDKVGRGETATTYAENVPVVDGKIALTVPAVEGKTYVVSVLTDNYADMSAETAYTVPVYVLMNIPYSEFYAGEGVADVDAVTSSTVKTFNQNMAGGSYHDKLLATEEEVKNSSILGVTYPVYVADRTVLADCKEILASDSAEITVAAGKSTTTTKEVSGADLLFASGDYAYFKLDTAPNNYKALSVDKDGKFSFSAVKEGAKKAEGMTASVTYGGHYTDIAYTVSAPELEGVTVNGIVITAGGEHYALRHVEDIWRITSLGWNWDSVDGSGLAGKTITSVTYYIKDAEGNYQVLRYDVNSAVKLQPAEITAAAADVNTITVSGVPADAQNVTATVKDQVGRGETATVYAENVPVTDGKIALTTPLVSGKTYVITVVSDNYADMTATVEYTAP